MVGTILPFSLSRNNRPYPPPPTHLCCLQIFFCSLYLKHIPTTAVLQHIIYFLNWTKLFFRQPEFYEEFIWEVSGGYKCVCFGGCTKTVEVDIVFGRVADGEGREDGGGWWVLSYNWTLNTSLAASTQNSTEYYHIIGPLNTSHCPRLGSCWHGETEVILHSFGIWERFITEDVFYVGEHVGLGFEKFDLSLSRGSRCRTWSYPQRYLNPPELRNLQLPSPAASALISSLR